LLKRLFPLCLLFCLSSCQWLPFREAAPAPTPTIAATAVVEEAAASMTVAPASAPPLAITKATPVWNTTDDAPYQPAMLPQAAGDIEQVGRTATRYFLDVTLEPGVPRLYGSERVIYTNNETSPLEALYFRLFPNTPSFGGGMQVRQAVIDGAIVTPILEAQNSALRLPLDPPLAPGARVDVTLWYETNIPITIDNGYGIYSFSHNTYSLAGFYAIIPAYDKKGWHIEVAPPYGDGTYTDMSLYQVRLTSPQNITWAMSGETISRQDNADGTQTVTAVSGPARDFNIIGSADYSVVSDEVDGVTINSYYLTNERAEGQKVLQYGRNALKYYIEKFGAYPYKEFDIAATPTTAGGVEYPGLISIASNLYAPQSDYLEFVVAHEAAHQWWYNLVGNDQVNEPWVDEALTNYSAVLYIKALYGPATFQKYIEVLFDQPYEDVKKEGQDQAVAGPVAGFPPENYSAIVYGKGPLFFRELQQQLGDEKFFRILQSYENRYKYRIATAEDLRQIIEEVGGRNIDSLYQHWILEPARRP
jgi:aminopeptidase N